MLLLNSKIGKWKTIHRYCSILKEHTFQCVYLSKQKKASRIIELPFFAIFILKSLL